MGERVDVVDNVTIRGGVEDHCKHIELVHHKPQVLTDQSCLHRELAACASSPVCSSPRSLHHLPPSIRVERRWTTRWIGIGE